VKDDRLYLEHIRDAIGRIATYSAAGREQFLRESACRDAVLRDFEVIRQAARRLTETTKYGCTEVPWRRVVSVCDALADRTMRVDAAEVWEVVEKRLPMLRAAVERRLQS